MPRPVAMRIGREHLLAISAAGEGLAERLSELPDPDIADAVAELGRQADALSALLGVITERTDALAMEPLDEPGDPNHQEPLSTEPCGTAHDHADAHLAAHPAGVERQGASHQGPAGPDETGPGFGPFRLPTGRAPDQSR